MNIYLELKNLHDISPLDASKVNPILQKLDKRVKGKLEEQSALETKIYVAVDEETKHKQEYAVFTLEKYHYHKSEDLHDVQYRFSGIE